MTHLITLPRATVQQALHVATAAGYPVALIAALKAALEQPARAQKMRDAAYTRRPTLREMVTPEQENPTRQMPEWMDYDQATDVLTIHGRRYSAAMFGERGFLSPAGTLLQVAEGQPDCVTLMTILPTEPK
jgi:hypothetical protein